MASLNGGTAALGRARGRGRGKNGAPGLGGAGAPALGGRGRQGRVNPPGQGMMNPPSQGNARPQGGQGGKGGALGGQALAGPGGRQLEARVQSGKITQQQAQKTMSQRQTLAKALGPDWRSKLSVGGKSFAQVNAGLKKSPGNATLAALRKKLISNRSSVLESARTKTGEGAGTAAKKGKKKPAAGSPAETLGE